MPYSVLPIFVDLTLQNPADKSRLAMASALLDEQFAPCILVPNSDAQKFILHGICEDHLETIIAEIRHGLSIPLQAGAPQVAYRETITFCTQLDYIFMHSSGSTAQFVQLNLQFEPMDWSNGFLFKNTANSITDEHAAAIAEGFEHAKECGTVSGFPCIGIQIALQHYNCSAELPASVIVSAAKAAFVEGFSKAKPVILQPIMLVCVGVPLKYKESIVRDLAQGSCKVRNIVESEKNDLVKAIIINASIPLAEMRGFTTWLTTNTGGAWPLRHTTHILCSNT